MTLTVRAATLSHPELAGAVDRPPHCGGMIRGAYALGRITRCVPDHRMRLSNRRGPRRRYVTPDRSTGTDLRPTRTHR